MFLLIWKVNKFSATDVSKLVTKAGYSVKVVGTE